MTTSLATIANSNSASSPRKRGILLLNLGSPDSTAVPDVRRYLRQFLMDERVLDIGWLKRKLLVELAILPSRPKETAHAYQKVWRADGSPLVVTSKRVRDLLAARVEMPVELAMRYGNPSTEAGLKKLLASSPDEVLVVPLYPHYAISSFETAYVEAATVLKRLAPTVKLKIFPPFFNDADYIEALVASASEKLAGGFDHLLFSYHGIPERHVQITDMTKLHCLKCEDCCQTPSPAHATCYRHQVHETTRAFVRKAGIPENRYSISFQSRLGKDPWLKPYTDLVLPELAQSGVKKLAVICPAFVSDCLETLEEIGMRAREDFLNAGGKEFVYIPCMNDHPRWIEALAKWSENF